MEEYYFRAGESKTIEELVINVLKEADIPYSVHKFIGRYHVKTGCYDLLEALAGFGYITGLEKAPKVQAF